MTPQRWKLALLFVWMIFLVIVVSNSWLGDDAYITFRTIENFLDGHGLRWNVAERVQSYSHPLWMATLATQTLISDNIYLTSLSSSIIFTAIATFIVLFPISRSIRMSLAIVLTMLLSKAFVDYSTSGLENPLTHAIVAIFFLIYFRFQKSQRAILGMYFLAGLAFLNRMDSILVFLPALARLFLRHKEARDIKLIAIAAIPPVLWELFSIIYYGSFVPNTAYAKLGTGIPASELAHQALHYFLNSLAIDKVTLPLIAVALIANYAFRRKLGNPLIEGAILYLIYVVKIGGDFMSGRFFALPFLMACIYLVRYGFYFPKLNRALPVVFIIAGLFSPLNPLYNNRDYGTDREAVGDAKSALVDPWGICDERGFYFRSTGLFSSQRVGDYPEHYWYYSGLSDKLHGAQITSQGGMGVGYYGYAVGPGVFVIDRYALCDPLLARLPARRVDPNFADSGVMGHLKWRIGHFNRTVPEGYPKSALEGPNQIKDPGVAEYYDKIVLITRGPLFSPSRIGAIIGLNLGRYDHLLDEHQKLVEAQDSKTMAERFSSGD